jgi:hypothetical protein
MMYGLIELACEAEDERVRSVCLTAVLDRGGVKPIDFDPNEETNAMSGASIAERKARLAELMERAAVLLSNGNSHAAEPQSEKLEIVEPEDE